MGKLGLEFGVSVHLTSFLIVMLGLGDQSLADHCWLESSEARQGSEIVLGP